MKETDMNTMEQVAILARVSTRGQDYERQVVELTDYCPVYSVPYQAITKPEG